jgi:SM-20-related protein
MLSQYFAQNLDQQLNKITEHGFCVMDNFLTQATVLALVNEITTLNDAARMHEAGTGRTIVGFNKQLRGDSIHWLDEAGASSAQQTYFGEMELLRLGLNRHLYLGLFALESHLALYPIGAGYKKHLDRFKTDNNSQAIDQPLRQISCILYLNQHWLEEDGGHLRLYLKQEDKAIDATYLDIAPVGGRLVVFLSDTFYHEVLPASRDRMSLTGWFLTR